MIWRQGLRSLRPGTLLFLVGLLLSTDFLEPDVPEFFQQVLGNGVFTVIAWVGLWYPLDLLLFARFPLRRELRALKALARMPIEVRAPRRHYLSVDASSRGTSVPDGGGPGSPGGAGSTVFGRPATASNTRIFSRPQRASCRSARVVAFLILRDPGA